MRFRFFFVTLQKIGTMGSEPEHAVEVLTERVNRLIERQNTLLQELAELRSRVADLETTNSGLQADLSAMTVNCEFLAMSHRLASSPDRLLQTRRLIAKMTRNIDRAIEDLR